MRHIAPFHTALVALSWLVVGAIGCNEPPAAAPSASPARSTTAATTALTTAPTVATASAHAPTAPPPNPVREPPAPAQPAATGHLDLVAATPEVPADIVIHNAVVKANHDGKNLLVYVGATWCAPCVRFKKAAKAGDFDAKLGGLRVLAFDADADAERLHAAGYTWTYVPVFVRPGLNGRSSGMQIAGVPNKESGADDLVPRIRELLARKP